MKKEKNLTMKEAMEFLEGNKGLVGFAGYTLLLKMEKISDQAEVTVDQYEKLVNITLNPEWQNKPKVLQLNTLLHELIHGRVLLFNKQREMVEEQMEKVIDDYEEHMVNDLTRGMELAVIK